MKKIFAPLIIALLACPFAATATDFTDTDQVYGWNGSAQIWQTWADHKTQLQGVFYTETEINALLADKADKENIAFNAASYSDLTITGSEQTAGTFETGVVYVITAVGTTDFTAIGASANTIGVEFTASGAGSGTGTATPLRPIISDTTPTTDKQKIAPTYEQMDEALALKQTIAGASYPSATSTTTGTGNINIDGASADHYYFSNGASTATYTPVITSPPASGYERGIVLTVGGGAGVITMTWINVTWLGTAGAATTTTNKYSSYGCFIRNTGNAICKIIAEAHD